MAGFGEAVTLLKFRTLPGRFAICRLAPDSVIPNWALTGFFYSVTRTPNELSITCSEAGVPADVQAERGFHCMQLEGPFDFQAIGILESFLAPLARAGVPVFAVSTYHTDCILIQEKHWEQALSALVQAGHSALDG
jgi:hypothetical protein